MLLQIVFWIKLIVPMHEPISRDLGQDGRGSNGILFGIALNNGLRVTGHLGGDTIAIDKGIVGFVVDCGCADNDDMMRVMMDDGAMAD